MKPWDTVAIVGVGLIGGSIGMGLRSRGLARQVIGVGRSTASLRIARERGAVTTTTRDLARGVRQADLVVVCTPLARIVDDVRATARACRPGTLITDAGSTKASIVEALDGTLPEEVHFLGSHPLAGSEKSGPGAASADLLRNRLVVLTPTAATRDLDRQNLERFWTCLGARVHCMPAEAHDLALAHTSHLTHLVASALAACTSRDDLHLAAQGWLDTTRVAAGDPALWCQILLDNARQVLPALDRFDRVVAQFRDALTRSDATCLTQILEQGKQVRHAVAS